MALFIILALLWCGVLFCLTLPKNIVYRDRLNPKSDICTVICNNNMCYNTTSRFYVRTKHLNLSFAVTNRMM